MSTRKHDKYDTNNLQAIFVYIFNEMYGCTKKQAFITIDLASQKYMSVMRVLCKCRERASVSRSETAPAAFATYPEKTCTRLCLPDESWLLVGVPG
ncbi:hypothetical protein [Photobacterium halotolerans]|uniref:Transposase n=1 Tax=Photobacterium halotolerans TaxID=265726 RepID=A0A0F5VH62_9GAMM|nr:hypothetical protein [Photobacterium halotolerans]KKD01398.1 hypothetical protein KY46_00775 [Photobacterium halotolerans]